MPVEQYFKTSYPDGFNDGYPVTIRYQEGYKTTRPDERKPQQYYSRTETCKMVSGQQVAPSFLASEAFSPYSEQVSALYAKAYGKLTSQLSRAELGTGLAEIGSTMDMVSKRLTDVHAAYRSLRQGNLRGLQRLCDINGHRKPPPLSVRKVSRDASSIWLEYWLGWAPTVGDAYASMEVLTGELPPLKIKGSSTLVFPVKGSRGNWSNSWEWDFNVKMGFRVTADVIITNPNLALLNQMGLANPMKVFYDLMPLSFVLEWFINFGQVLSSFSDFLGFTLSNCWTTEKLMIEGESKQSSYGLLDFEIMEKYHTFSRSSGIENPDVVVKRVRGLSPTRGATAISLLTQLFISDNLAIMRRH